MKFRAPPDGFLEGSIYRLPLYHGSDRKPQLGHGLRPDVGGEYGIYLATKARYARNYGSHLAEVYASVRAPLIVDGKYAISPRDLTLEDIERVKAQGYDAIVVTSSLPDVASEVVLFQPEQAWVSDVR